MNTVVITPEATVIKPVVTEDGTSSLPEFEAEADDIFGDDAPDALLAQSDSTGEDSVINFGDEDEGDSQEEGMPEGSEDEEETDIGVFTIAKPECLKCTALFAGGTKLYKSCHFTAGNEDCPAASARIVIGIPVGKAVLRILEAEESGDTLALAKCYTILAGKDPAVRQMVMDAVAQEREARKNQG